MMARLQPPLWRSGSMEATYVSTLPEPDRKRYVQKIEGFSKETYRKDLDPYEIAPSEWIDDVSLWPPLDFGSLYVYLIDTKGTFTKESLKAYKSLEAYNYYINGWVQTVFCLFVKTNPDVCLLKGNVKPSQAINNKAHQAWVAVNNKDAEVLTGHCTCMAGCGGVCSHVAAILFKVEACCRLEITKLTCTSIPCLWNQTYSKKVRPSTISCCDFFKPKKKRRLNHVTVRSLPSSQLPAKPCLTRDFILSEIYPVEPSSSIFTVVPGFPSTSTHSTQSSRTPLSVENTSFFDQSVDPPSPPSGVSVDPSPPPTGVSVDPSPPPTDVSVNPSPPPTGVSVAQSSPLSPLALLVEQSSPVIDSQQSSPSAALPCPLSLFYDENLADSSEDHIKDVCNVNFSLITVTQVEADNLYNLTQQQSNSKLWFEHRLGRITASIMHRVLHCKEKSYPMSIVKTVMQYYNVNENIPQLKWGRENESVARDCYFEDMKKKHQNFKLSLSGLVIDPTLPYLGASPDGVSSCDCCGKRLVEIKCPYKYRHQHPLSISDPQFFLKRNNHLELHLSKQHSYYTQVQGQLFLSHESCCDFVCWTPQGMFVETIVVDNDLKAILIPKLEAFFRRYILPELLLRRHDPANTSASNIKETVSYCFCSQPESGLMVACDNPGCPIEWFHYTCVGIKRKPRGEWYCSLCKELCDM